MQAFNSEEFNRLVRNRRSIYPNMYNSKPVESRIINMILENANWAPNHKHTEPWRFVVFTGDGLKKLSEFQGDLYKKVSMQKGTYKETTHAKLMSKLLMASHIISIGLKRDPRQSIPEIEEILAIGCAIQNMYLTATSNNIGCYMSTGGVTYFDEAKEFFGLNREDKLLGFMYLGNTDVKPLNVKRRPWQDKVRWEN